MRYIGFWSAKSKYGFLSNFYECRVVVIDHIFSSAEQAFHYYKAILFNDEEIAEQILQSRTPKEAKALGRKVKNFDKKMWDENKVIICKMILRNKFNYNDDLKQKLLNTGDDILVECSPYDRIWGIGYNDTDPVFLYRQTDLWGENLLGKCLMDIRKELRKEAS